MRGLPAVGVDMVTGAAIERLMSVICGPVLAGMLQRGCRHIILCNTQSLDMDGVRVPEAAPLRIYICGRLAIEHADGVVRESDFPARQGRRLWAYLVLNRRRPVSRDELVDALWGTEIPDTWDTTINALVSRLRRLLRGVVTPDDIGIRGEVGRYMLQLPPTTFIDYERARSAIHATETSLRQGDHAAALSEARVALEIASRGFLTGEEGPWIVGERQVLRDIQVRSLEATIEAELARGNPTLAEIESRELIKLDPLLESGYRLLMRSLAEGGKAAQVPAIMQRCRQALAEYAEMAPSAETERLYQQLIAR
jgi:DNA-binding SARP family transcriptional activator